MRMSKHLPVWFLVCSALALLVLNGVFEYYHLYFFIWWLDVPMHFLGGMFVAFLALAIVFHDRFILGRGTSSAFITTIAVVFAFAVGALWEYYAVQFGHRAPAPGGLIADTIKDLINDMLGGFLAAMIFIRKGYNKTI
jgi:hypothetical protein